MATTEKPVVATGTNGTNAVPHHQQNSYLHHPDYAALGEGVMAPPFGGALQPGLWRPYEHRKFANPAPLGLSAFALTTFVLSCVNMHARDVTIPNIAVPLAFGYGGLVQLLAGMWYVASFPRIRRQRRVEKLREPLLSGFPARCRFKGVQWLESRAAE